MRRIGIVTVARSDYGIYKPLLRRLRSDPGIRLELFVSGSHLWRDQGRTVREIEADRMPIVQRIPMPRGSDAPLGVARAIAAGVEGFARAFTTNRPHIAVVLGDRFEMFSAAVAALPLKIPVAHLHGGELTRGAFDDALRHSMTKLSHLHFVSTEAYSRRVRQLGEEDWRVVVSGALSLDNLEEVPLLTAEEIEDRWGVDVSRPFLLATFHPTTLDAQPAELQMEILLRAIERVGLPAVFTLPNADPGGLGARRVLDRFVKAQPHMRRVDSLGLQGYFSLMARAAAMAGNSSSGIIEAPSFRLPVVNIGARQAGRLRARNVIDVPCRVPEIVRALRKAVQPAFRRSLRALRNPYRRGGAAQIIARTLKQVSVDDRLLRKDFGDMPGRA